MSIEVEKTSFGKILKITINRKKVLIDGETYYIPDSYLVGLKTKEIPIGLQLTICKTITNDIPGSNLPFPQIVRISGNKLKIQLDEGRNYDYHTLGWTGWDYDFSPKLYYSTMKDVVQNNKNFKYESFHFDSKYVGIVYSYTSKSSNVESFYKSFENLYFKVHEFTLDALGVIKEQQFDKLDTEREFIYNILMPLIRKIGFVNIIYNHGKNEYGKDIIFSRVTEFYDVEYWGLQAKFGNISGENKSDIDTIISQIDDSFKMPFIDLYSKSEQYISKLVIAISGKFTFNSINKILNKIESRAILNNIYFLDGQRIHSLQK